MFAPQGQPGQLTFGKTPIVAATKAKLNQPQELLTPPRPSRLEAAAALGLVGTSEPGNGHRGGVAASWALATATFVPSRPAAAFPGLGSSLDASCEKLRVGS